MNKLEVLFNGISVLDVKTKKERVDFTDKDGKVLISFHNPMETDVDTNKKDMLHKFICGLKINIFEQDAVASIGGIYLEDFDKEDLVLLSNALLIKSSERNDA